MCAKIDVTVHSLAEQGEENVTVCDIWCDHEKQRLFHTLLTMDYEILSSAMCHAG